MKIQLKQLFDIVGERKEINYEIPLEELKGYKAVSFKTPVSINGEVENRAGIVTLRFKLSFVLNHVCDRCLKRFEQEYDYDFEHTLVQNSKTDDNEHIVCENMILDLNELAISDLLLQLPSKILCKEDCKGLCYICGQNLNESACECSKSQ